MLTLKEFADDLMYTLNDQLNQMSMENKRYAEIISKDGRSQIVSILDCPYRELAEKHRHKAGAYSIQGFDLKDLYLRYRECKSVEEVAERILERFLPMQTAYDISEIADYSYVKDHMVIRCVNRSFFNRLYNDAVCYHFSDITMYIQIAVEVADEIRYTDLTKDMFEDYRIGKQRLLRDAMISSLKLCKPVCIPLSEMIQIRDASTSSVLQEKTQRLNSIYVVTNESLSYASAAMFYPPFLKSLGDQYGGNFYIVPDSVHNLLTFPDTEDIDPESWQSYLLDKNGMLEPDEKLSDHLFYYDAERRALRTCVTHSCSQKNGFRFS